MQAVHTQEPQKYEPPKPAPGPVPHGPAQEPEKKEGEDDKSEEGAPMTEETQKLGEEVAKAQQKQEEILEHSPGVIPPVAPMPSMEELLKGSGGKEDDK